MTIKLNEVPESVLTALNVHAFKRGFCTVTAILCCLPTFSFSASYCDDKEGYSSFENQGSGCCYMGCLSPAEEGTLKGLKEALEHLILAGDYRVQSGENPTTVALDQAQKTIELLKKTKIQNFSYIGLLTSISNEVQARLKMHHEVMPLLGSVEIQRGIFKQPTKAMQTNETAFSLNVQASAPPEYS